MFTRKYCNKIQSKSESRLNPIEVFMKDLLLNVGYYNDTFLNSKKKKESIASSNRTSLSRLGDCYKYKTIATGLTQEDLVIYIEERTLIIHTKVDKNNVLLNDPFKVEVNHKVKLKDKVDKDNITAILCNGILEVVIPFDNSEEWKHEVKFV